MTKKISQLNPAATLDGTELVELEQASASVRTTTQDIADLGGSGSGFSGAGTAITSLLPLGKVTDATPLGDPGLYAPTSTDPEDGGWIDLGWASGRVYLGAGDLSSGGVAAIKFGTVNEFVVQENVGNGFLSMQLNASRAYFAMQAVAGQTDELIELADEDGNTVFTVGPDGAIATCNGVAVPITGVGVNIASVHAALVTLGLITT